MLPMELKVELSVVDDQALREITDWRVFQRLGVAGDVNYKDGARTQTKEEEKNQ